MTTTSPIMPSVGRIVLVNMGDHDPVPGIVTRVFTKECINVTVIPDGGLPAPYSSILYAEDHTASGQYVSWHWMDYQVKVAAERDPATGEVVATG